MDQKRITEWYRDLQWASRVKKSDTGTASGPVEYSIVI